MKIVVRRGNVRLGVPTLKISTLLALFVLAMALAGCGSTTTTPKSTAVPSSVTRAQTELASATADPTIAAQYAAYATPAVSVSDGSGVRRILTDTSGFALYVFADDVAASGVSHCTGECASTWPPFAIPYGPGFQIPGLGLFGTFRRDDGLRQVTYRGRPLYKYSGDKAPGDTNGDGVGGRWSVAVP